VKRGAAVDLLPLLDQGGPDSFLEAAFLTQATGGVAHQDGCGPTGGCLQILDEGLGGARHVGQRTVEELKVFLLVDDHAAVDGAAEVVGLQALTQIRLVSGSNPLEQAGDLVDKQVRVRGHGLETRHRGLVALVGLPDQLENRLTPAGVADPNVPGQIQAVKAGDPGVVNADVGVRPRLVGGDPLTGGDPVVRGLRVVRDREVLGDQLVPGQGDEAADRADALEVDRFLLWETVVDQQD